MKKTLTTILCLLLVAVVALSLVACGEKEEQIPKKDPVSQYKAYMLPTQFLNCNL